MPPWDGKGNAIRLHDHLLHDHLLHDHLLHDHLLHEAYRRAQRLGLRDSDAQDYASIFLLKYLELDPGIDHAYRVRSGHHAALDHLRSERRRQRGECAWPSEDAADGILAFSAGFPAPEPSPEGSLLRGEVRQWIETDVARLSREQQTLWRLVLVEGRSPTEAASVLGRSPQAVRQALLSIRKRVRAFLKRQGMDDEAAREYLYELAKYASISRRSVQETTQEGD